MSGIRIFLVVLLACLLGCTAVQRIEPTEATGLLRFEVVPSHAEVWIDEEYRGRIDGWTMSTMRVRTGHRMVKLSAKGYMTQRFDIDVRRHEEVTLVLRMEEELELLREE